MRLFLKITMAFTVAAAGIWGAATSSYAHYLWVQEMDGTYAICRGTDFESLNTYNPACVTQVAATSPDGTELPITRTNENDRVVFTTVENPAIVTVTSEWGDRVNTTHGKKLMDRQSAEAAGLTVVSTFTSTQFSKTLFASSVINSQALGLRFELVPLADPMTLPPGTPMAFKLLFDGRPLAGVSIRSSLNQEYKTDANGVAQITFEKSGEHLLYATHKVPAENTSALDYRKFMTFITFEVEQ
jgi:hypothetical protein